MRKDKLIASFMMVIACLLLCSGCGLFGKKGTGPDGDTSLDMLTVDDEMTLGDERVYGGTKVPAEEFSPSAVSFAYDSYKIAASELSKIERTAEFMKRKKDVRLVVEGHCDERGSRDYNMSLGEHRAIAIRTYLVKLGVDAVRIQTRSYGEEQPVDAGHDERAWRANRRGEFALYR